MFHGVIAELLLLVSYYAAKMYFVTFCRNVSYNTLEVYKMIGILCQENKKNIYSRKFYELINREPCYKMNPIIVFSINDIDFKNKTVSGNLINQKGIKSLKTQIPSIINNFMYPRKRMGKKKIRELAEYADIVLINEANRYKQHMIMEMLLSSPKTKVFVPSYSIYNSKSGDINKIMHNRGGLIVPEDSDDSKTLYTAGDIIKDQSCLLSKKKWLAIDIPTVITIYAVRGDKGNWNALPLCMSELGIEINNELKQFLENSVLEIAKCIGGFIPSLAFCTIKIKIYGNYSFFLNNFSGWDSSLIENEHKSNLFNIFANHYLNYNNMLLNKEGED